jgi:hypothetical protein
MTKVMYWSMDKFCLMIIQMLLNKFDCFIVIEGNRGLGKSTFAFQISKKIKNMLRKIIQATGDKQSPYYKWYDFKPQIQSKNPFGKKFILYKRDDVINFYDKWHSTAISDEMINVSFNREFWNDDQKNLIKMINMNRDHCNLFIACVPQFQVLDNQIKNLCKIRITIARRGLAVIQTPNRTIYCKDKWDTANNERIEREWLKNGSGLPQYSRLNTFRGMIRFPALTKKEQEIYDNIKVAERNVIKKDLGVKEETDENDPFERILKKLLNGGVRSSVELKGVAFAIGLTDAQLQGKLSRRLEQMQKPTQLSYYFWDKRTQDQENPNEKSVVENILPND